MNIHSVCLGAALAGIAALVSPARAASITLNVDANAITDNISYGKQWNYSQLFAAAPVDVGAGADALEITLNLSHALTVKDFTWLPFFVNDSYSLFGMDFVESVSSSEYFDFTQKLMLAGTQVGSTREAVMWGHGPQRVQLDFFEPDWGGLTFDRVYLKAESPFSLHATGFDGFVIVNAPAVVPEAASTLGLLLGGLVVLFGGWWGGLRFRRRAV